MSKLHPPDNKVLVAGADWSSKSLNLVQHRSWQISLLGGIQELVFTLVVSSLCNFFSRSQRDGNSLN